MTSEEIPVHLHSWTRLRTTHLAVETVLLGQSHTFTWNDKAIDIKLPEAPTDDEEAESLRVYSYREEEGKKVPLAFLVLEVDIRADIAGDFHLPQGILERSPNAGDLLTPQQRRRLEECAASEHRTLFQAFDFWTRAMRWSTGLSSLGRDMPNFIGTGWATYLIDAARKRRVWANPLSFTHHGTPKLTQEKWNAAQELLHEIKEVPIWIDLLHEARFHLITGDLRRVVSDAAVAVDSHVRALVQDSMAPSTGPLLRRMVDETNIRQMLKGAYGEARVSMGLQPIKIVSEIQQLFDFRNKILHKGEVENLTKDQCRKMLDAAFSLIEAK